MTDKMDALVERLALLRYNQIWQLDDESWPEEAASNEREACRAEAREIIDALTHDDLRYLIEREGKWKVIRAPRDLNARVIAEAGPSRDAFEVMADDTPRQFDPAAKPKE